MISQSSHSGTRMTAEPSIDHDFDPKRGIYNSIEIDLVVNKKGQSMEFERNFVGAGTYGDNNSTHYTNEMTADLQRRTATISRSGMNSSLLTHEHKFPHSNNDYHTDSGMLIESSMTNYYGTNPPLASHQYSSSVQKRKEPSKYANSETVESFKRPSKEPRKTMPEERRNVQEETVRTYQKTFVSKKSTNEPNQGRTHQTHNPNLLIEQSGRLLLIFNHYSNYFNIIKP